jgi:hypothetical protein
VPVLIAPNTSIGVTLLIELVRAAARALPATYDIEIVESHHRAKRDAPSGTALALGRAAAEGRGASLESLRLPDARDGQRVEGGSALRYCAAAMLSVSMNCVSAGPVKRSPWGTAPPTGRSSPVGPSRRPVGWSTGRPGDIKCLM